MRFARRVVVPLALAAVVIAPSSAAAATRYAGPGAPNGAPCTAASPCSLTSALTLSAAGDEIVLLPGDYPGTPAFLVDGGRTMRGRDGAAATRVTLTGTMIVQDARIADLTVRSTTVSPLDLRAGAVAERLDVRSELSGGAFNRGVSIQPGALLRDSVVRASGGTSAYAIYPAGASSTTLSAALRNVTAIATGGSSYGMYMNLPNVGDPTTWVMRARNVIIRGDTKDVYVVGAGNQRLDIGSSMFSPAASSLPPSQVTDLGGNITASPAFFSATDPHQLGTSPTVNRGVVDPLTGTQDIDGQPRVMGGAPDIGADEHPGPFGAPPGLPSGNLLVNGGGESGTGAADATGFGPVPGWTTSPSFTAVRFGAPGGFPTAGEGARIGGGANFFAGGPDAAVSTAEQRVDLSAAAGDIDAGRATATLAGDLGGFSTQTDAATVIATFRGADGGALGTLRIGAVTPIDRGGDTVLLRQSADGAVPAGTRRIDVVVTATNSGAPGTYNDGYADNLVLALTRPPASSGTDPAGAGGSTTQPGSRDTIAPAIGGLRLSKRAFRRNTSARPRKPRSATLTFTLSEPASVRVLVQRATPGRRVRGRCVKLTSTRRTPRCTRWVEAGALRVSGKAGANSLRVTGIVGGKALPAGRYRLVLVATDAAGNRATATGPELRLLR